MTENARRTLEEMAMFAAMVQALTPKRAAIAPVKKTSDLSGKAHARRKKRNKMARESRKKNR